MQTPIQLKVTTLDSCHTDRMIITPTPTLSIKQISKVLYIREPVNNNRLIFVPVVLVLYVKSSWTKLLVTRSFRFLSQLITSSGEQLDCGSDITFIFMLTYKHFCQIIKVLNHFAFAVPSSRPSWCLCWTKDWQNPTHSCAPWLNLSASHRWTWSSTLGPTMAETNAIHLWETQRDDD